MTFWIVFAAVISANLLTVMFVCGLIAYTRHEKAGTAGSRDSNLPLGAILMPMLFCLGGLMIATDSVPAWLDAILQ